MRPWAQEAALAPRAHHRGAWGPINQNRTLSGDREHLAREVHMKHALRIGADRSHEHFQQHVPAPRSLSRTAPLFPLRFLLPHPILPPQLIWLTRRLRCAPRPSTLGPRSLGPKGGVRLPNVRGGKVYQNRGFMCVLVYPTLAFLVIRSGVGYTSFSGVGYTHIAAGRWVGYTSCWLVAAVACRVDARC